MPRRLTTRQVKDLFAEYGYIVPDDFVYRNNKQKVRVYDEMNNVHVEMSLQKLKYQTHRAATLRPRYFVADLLNMPLAETESTPTGSSYERWCEGRSEDFNDLDEEYKQAAFEFYTNSIPSIARHQNVTFSFDDYSNIPQVYGLVEALKTVNYANYDVRLTITDFNGNVSYAHANENTINFLYNSFSEVQDIGDSSDVLLNNICDVKTMSLDFRPKTNAGVQAPGFFPFINKSTYDLTRYGIYNNEDDIINESCLLTVIRSSGVLADDQVKLLSSMVKTRNVMKSDLRKISEEFKFNVHVRLIKDGGKDSHYEIINDESYPKIKMVVVLNHYMLNETMMFEGKRLAIPTIIKKLMDKQLLEPISEKKMWKLVKEFEATREHDVDTHYRLVNVKDVKVRTKYDVKQGKRFFGYVPNDNEINERLKELQEAIDTLPLRRKINVRHYYRFSELGQKILYETGCYDGVYEMTGKKASQMRKSLVFPKTRLLTNTKTFYSNEKLYYLDINAAYMNFLKYIPSGKDDGIVNYTIGDVIRQLYELREKAKREGKNKLATTIKFIMNATWGYSIQRPRLVKNKFVNSVDFYSKKYQRFLIKVNGNYVSTVNTFVPHYTIPQFARSVLCEYNKFFTYVKSIIPVYYENVDAVLTNEEGYHKLISEGLVGEGIGKFKLDKVFTEIAIISDRSYVATTIDGERVFHCTKRDYDDVVTLAKTN